MKKSLLFGLLAAAAVLVILSGCPTDTDIEYRDVPGKTTTLPGSMIHVDAAFGNEDDLRAALEGGAYLDKVIGVSAAIALRAPLTIGTGYTVYILNGGSLATDEKAGLTVTGTLWVGYGGTLTADTSSDGEPVTVNPSGAVKVAAGGTLSITDADSITDGADTVLGSSQAAITGNLAVTGELEDYEAVPALWGYVTKGLLDLSGASWTTAPKPSEIAGLDLPGIGADKGLKATAGTAEEADALNIPEGMDLDAGSLDLDGITALTVNGTLTAEDATLDDENGAVITVGPKGKASIGAVTLAAGTSSVAGELVLNGDLTVPEGAVLFIVNPSKVSGAAGTEVITAEDGTITIGAANSGDGFTTAASGVEADSLADAWAALSADLGKLRTLVTLDGAFGQTTERAIGTAAPENETEAVDVTRDPAGGEGTAVSISEETTFEGTVPDPTISGTNDDITGTIALTVADGVLQVGDGDYDDEDDTKYAILTFADVQLNNSDLLSPPITFSIGLLTSR